MTVFGPKKKNLGEKYSKRAAIVNSGEKGWFFSYSSAFL
jgi:hypothetical protein